MRVEKRTVLAIFSDVNFSPQLVAVLKELRNRQISTRIILIGNHDTLIAKQIQSFGWEMRMIKKRGKFASVFNFILIFKETVMHQPTVVFASGQFATILGILVARVMNVPERVFVRHHSNYHHLYKMRVGILLDKIANRLATKIVAVSSTVKNILVNFEKASAKKISVIYNGIELETFQKPPRTLDHQKKQGNTKEKTFRIGVISRLTDCKGVEYTARAFIRIQSEFAGCHLHVVGAPADADYDVRTILSEINSDLYTLDTEKADIPSFLQNLSAFVHVPNGSEDEAFGLVYIEALASGVPSIFTISGILNELENPNKYSHIVGYRSSEEIYSNLKSILKTGYKPKDAIPNIWLDQFSLEQMSIKYADLLLDGR